MKCLDCDTWMKRVNKLNDYDDSECESYWKCPKCGFEIEESEYWEMR